MALKIHTHSPSPSHKNLQNIAQNDAFLYGVIRVEREADGHIKLREISVDGLEAVGGAGVADVLREIAELGHMRAVLELETRAILEIFSPSCT